MILLNKKRSSLHAKIQVLKTTYKKLVDAGDVDAAKICAEKIVRQTSKHETATAAWLAALSDKEELEVKRIRTLDKWTGALNMARLVLAGVAISGAILSVIPATLPIGAIILFVTLCVSIVLVGAHYINKFHLIRKEKAIANLKKLEFTPSEELDSSPRILKSLSRDNLPINLLNSPSHKAIPDREKAGVVHHNKKGFIQSIFPAVHSRAITVDQDESPNSVNGLGS
jgi:hypothetical protein